MLNEIGIPSLFLLLAFGAVTAFFCQVGLAPAAARKLAQAERFRAPNASEKVIRFW